MVPEPNVEVVPVVTDVEDVEVVPVVPDVKDVEVVPLRLPINKWFAVV